MNRLIISILIILVATYSCKSDCSRAFATIGLVAFQPDETDTVVVKKFNKQSHFTALLDSFSFNASNSHFVRKNDTLEILSSFGPDMGFLSDYDYEIYLPRVNRLLRVSEIREDFRSQSNFLSCTKELCLNSFESYKINGDPVEVKSFLTFYFNK